MNSKKIFLAIILMLLPVSNAWAADKIKITATTSTFAAIAREIAGEAADIYYVASPRQNLHFIVPTPKDVLKVRRADVFVHGGLDLEVWRGPLLDAAGRTAFMGEEAARAIDVSRGIEMKEIPISLSRSHGDIHAHGNPHYWTDPLNGKIIAENISRGLSKLYPDRAGTFEKNLKIFQSKIDEKLGQWQMQLAPYQGFGIVVYHDSWPYFLERFRLSTLGYLEAKPGIPPTPKHLEEIIALLKERKQAVIVTEVFLESRAPRHVSRETGVPVVMLSSEAGESGGDYFKMMDENISKLARAFAGVKKS